MDHPLCRFLFQRTMAFKPEMLTDYKTANPKGGLESTSIILWVGLAAFAVSFALPAAEGSGTMAGWECAWLVLKAFTNPESLWMALLWGGLNYTIPPFVVLRLTGKRPNIQTGLAVAALICMIGTAFTLYGVKMYAGYYVWM